MKHTQKFLQQRKFMMVVPGLVLPFMTTVFWALGGGTGMVVNVKAEAPGLNLELPTAHFSEEGLDKLSLYERARRDSLRLQEALDSDPYFKLEGLESVADEWVSKQNPAKKSRAMTDLNELMVTSKLDELYRELNRKPAARSIDGNQTKETETNAVTKTASAGTNQELQQLNSMMERMRSRRQSSSDPEEARIGSMLDKILDVQHPERVKQRLADAHENEKVFAVESHAKRASNVFYGLDDESRQSSDSAGNTLEAVFHDTQELVSGSTVKMRLVHDVFVNGELMAKDQFIYGTAGINGERLTIAISSMRSGKLLLPVKLEAYDLDGLEGIYIPGAITRDAAKQSSDQAIQGMQFMTMDQSLGAQAGAAGVQAAKGLFSKKVKLVRVKVKAGYKILLKDETAAR